MTQKLRDLRSTIHGIEVANRATLSEAEKSLVANACVLIHAAPVSKRANAKLYKALWRLCKANPLTWIDAFKFYPAWIARSTGE